MSDQKQDLHKREQWHKQLTEVGDVSAHFVPQGKKIKQPEHNIERNLQLNDPPHE